MLKKVEALFLSLKGPLGPVLVISTLFLNVLASYLAKSEFLEKSSLFVFILVVLIWIVVFALRTWRRGKSPARKVAPKSEAIPPSAHEHIRRTPEEEATLSDARKRAEDARKEMDNRNWLDALRLYDEAFVLLDRVPNAGSDEWFRHERISQWRCLLKQFAFGENDDHQRGILLTRVMDIPGDEDVQRTYSDHDASHVHFFLGMRSLIVAKQHIGDLRRKHEDRANAFLKLLENGNFDQANRFVDDIGLLRQWYRGELRDIGTLDLRVGDQGSHPLMVKVRWRDHPKHANKSGFVVSVENANGTNLIRNVSFRLSLNPLDAPVAPFRPEEDGNLFPDASRVLPGMIKVIGAVESLGVHQQADLFRLQWALPSEVFNRDLKFIRATLDVWGDAVEVKRRYINFPVWTSGRRPNF